MESKSRQHKHFFWGGVLTGGVILGGIDAAAEGLWILAAYLWVLSALSLYVMRDSAKDITRG